jgi:hypothetical protein
MNGVLPDSVRLRTDKVHFGSVFREELCRNWSAYARLFGPGSRPAIAERGYVAETPFWDRLEELRAGRALCDVSTIRMIGLEVWLSGLDLPRRARVTPQPRSTRGAQRAFACSAS